MKMGISAGFAFGATAQQLQVGDVDPTPLHHIPDPKASIPVFYWPEDNILLLKIYFNQLLV